MNSTDAAKGAAPTVAKRSAEDLDLESEEPKQAINPLESEKWTEVFRFKYIIALRVAVRLKIYQTAAGAVSMASFLVLPLFGVEPDNCEYIMDALGSVECGS